MLPYKTVIKRLADALAIPYREDDDIYDRQKNAASFFNRVALYAASKETQVNKLTLYDQKFEIVFEDFDDDLLQDALDLLDIQVSNATLKISGQLWGALKLRARDLRECFSLMATVNDEYGSESPHLVGCRQEIVSAWQNILTAINRLRCKGQKLPWAILKLSGSARTPRLARSMNNDDI